MLGAATTRMGGAALSVTALPLAAAVAAGVALAARPQADRSGPRWPAVAYAAVAALALLPLDVAHAHYGFAVAAAAAGDAGAARRESEAAARWDPSLPLYGARGAWLQASAGAAAAAEPARAAAASAVAVGPLWLQAGALGSAAGAPWATAALSTACALDPLGGPAPFHLAMASAERDPPRAARLAARALLAEPRYLAASFWSGRTALRAAALAEVERWPGIDRGWRDVCWRSPRSRRRAAAPARPSVSRWTGSPPPPCRFTPSGAWPGPPRSRVWRSTPRPRAR